MHRRCRRAGTGEGRATPVADVPPDTSAIPRTVVGTISPDFDVNGDGVVNAFESAGGEVGGNVFLVATRRWPSRTATFWIASVW